MKKETNYNKPLRSFILICSIRCEETASEALKNLFRIVKPESKTLGNKSSCLTFRNKIDLLFDIDDLNKDEYNYLIKFMEIRNQFIHNPYCNSFIDIEKQDKSLTSFLKNKFPNNKNDKEDSYLQSFKELFAHSFIKLEVLKREYDRGYTDELHRYVNANTLLNFKIIYKSALEHWRTDQATNTNISLDNKLILNNIEKILTDFQAYVTVAIYDEKIRMFAKLENEEISEKEIFSRRIDMQIDLKSKLMK